MCGEWYGRHCSGRCVVVRLERGGASCAACLVCEVFVLLGEVQVHFLLRCVPCTHPLHTFCVRSSCCGGRELGGDVAWILYHQGKSPLPYVPYAVQHVPPSAVEACCATVAVVCGHGCYCCGYVLLWCSGDSCLQTSPEMSWVHKPFMNGLCCQAGLLGVGRDPDLASDARCCCGTIGVVLDAIWCLL